MEPVQSAALQVFSPRPTASAGDIGFAGIDVTRDVVSDHDQDDANAHDATARSAAFLKFFWDAPSLQAVATRLASAAPDEPFSHLSWHAIVAARHHQSHGADRLDDAGSTARNS